MFSYIFRNKRRKVGVKINSFMPAVSMFPLGYIMNYNCIREKKLKHYSQIYTHLAS